MPDIGSLSISALFFDILIKSLFVLAIIRTLQQVNPVNRRISPVLVWPLIIPFLNLLWNFFVAIELSRSIRNELASRDFEVKGYPTLIYGILYALINLGSFFVAVPTDIQNLHKNYLYVFFSLAVVIIFILYWTKINWYKAVLINDSAENESKDEL
ncbi:MAG: hypothetical protein H7Y13_08040 [Sphingobacteriaceae bacterium]|nr:hypothetical protein [Sphingobacteriaceae bacterium]